MKKNLLSLAVITALSSTALMAADVRVSGFMNVIGGQSSENYRGYDDQYDFQNESLAAVQISGTIAENMSATVQLIAQKQEAGDDIRLEWGFVSYDVTDEVRILAGRIRPALFLYSDYLDVGYAYTWITPPSEVYDQVNISNLDGASIAYNMEIGDNTLSMNLYAGNSSDKKVNPNNPALPYNLLFDNIIGGEISLSNDYGKIRAGYIQASVTETTMLAIVPAELKVDKAAATFYGLGINIDYENILFASEYIVRDMDETATADLASYYAMLGYRIGDFTPNYTYSVADSDMDFSNSSTVSEANMVNGARAGNLDDRTSHTFGLRYELNSQAAIKLEYNLATVTTSTYAGANKLNETDSDIKTARIALNVIF